MKLWAVTSYRPRQSCTAAPTTTPQLLPKSETTAPGPSSFSVASGLLAISMPMHSSPTSSAASSSVHSTLSGGASRPRRSRAPPRPLRSRLRRPDSRRAPVCSHADIGCESRPDQTLFGVAVLLRRSDARDLPAADLFGPACDSEFLAAVRGLQVRRHDAGILRQRTRSESRAHELLGDAGDVARRRGWRLQMHRTARNVLLEYCIEETGVIYNCRYAGA